MTQIIRQYDTTKPLNYKGISLFYMMRLFAQWRDVFYACGGDRITGGVFAIGEKQDILRKREVDE